MIQSRIERKPGQTFDFLSELDADKLADTLVAFANSDGGTLLAGIAEDGAVDGHLMPEDVQDTLRLALGRCSPGVRTEWRESELEGGRMFNVTEKCVFNLSCKILEMRNQRFDG